MSTSMYSIHDKLCAAFDLDPSDNPIPNSLFDIIDCTEFIRSGRPSNAFPVGNTPWNYGQTKETNDIIKRAGEKTSIARKKYFENWHKHNKKKVYVKKGYDKTSSASKERAIERNKIKIMCPHCNKEGQLANMKRWHFENCNELRNSQITTLQ